MPWLERRWVALVEQDVDGNCNRVCFDNAVPIDFNRLCGIAGKHVHAITPLAQDASLRLGRPIRV